jgi:hypothetical protein
MLGVLRLNVVVLNVVAPLFCDSKTKTQEGQFPKFLTTFYYLGVPKVQKSNIIKQVASNKACLLLQIILLNMQTLQLFTQIIGNVTQLKGNKIAAVLRHS